MRQNNFYSTDKNIGSIQELAFEILANPLGFSVAFHLILLYNAFKIFKVF
jgi:hypothetical protein